MCVGWNRTAFRGIKKRNMPPPLSRPPPSQCYFVNLSPLSPYTQLLVSWSTPSLPHPTFYDQLSLLSPLHPLLPLASIILPFYPLVHNQLTGCNIATSASSPFTPAPPPNPCSFVEQLWDDKRDQIFAQLKYSYCCVVLRPKTAQSNQFMKRSTFASNIKCQNICNKKPQQCTLVHPYMLYHPSSKKIKKCNQNYKWDRGILLLKSMACLN